MVTETFKDDFSLPRLEVVADEPTRALEAKAGKVVWALTEFEVALPDEAKRKVHELKYRIAVEMDTIIRTIGKYKTV
jgi:hypothetical protein